MKTYQSDTWSTLLRGFPRSTSQNPDRPLKLISESIIYVRNFDYTKAIFYLMKDDIRSHLVWAGRSSSANKWEPAVPKSTIDFLSRKHLVQFKSPCAIWIPCFIEIFTTSVSSPIFHNSVKTNKVGLWQHPQIVVQSTTNLGHLSEIAKEKFIRDRFTFTMSPFSKTASANLAKSWLPTTEESVLRSRRKTSAEVAICTDGRSFNAIPLSF